MGTKSEQLQIRISSAEKAALKQRAAAAGMGLSAYVLSRALPPGRDRLAELVVSLSQTERAGRSYVLAELNDFLAGLAGFELADAVERADLAALDPYLRNYVAAMVEQACYLRGVASPAWASEVSPLEEPRFATDLESLRPHLLRESPVPFKRRNIFIDASIGDRV
ncbi:MAG: plasmid mobilization protein [Gemmatimonadota bacterium]|jgi:uncharacterized protein (DUF1778 family)